MLIKAVTEEMLVCPSAISGIAKISLPENSQHSKYTNITSITWVTDAENPDLLNVKVSGEYEFIHRSNARGTTNYISLNSNIAKYGGVVVTEGRHVKLPCKVEGEGQTYKYTHTYYYFKNTRHP